MSISRDSTDEQIASHIKALKQQQEGLDERRQDLVIIEQAALKRSLGALWMRRFVVGALCRECLRLRQEVKELQKKLADRA
jgi:hypothetical protein